MRRGSSSRRRRIIIAAAVPTTRECQPRRRSSRAAQQRPSIAPEHQRDNDAIVGGGDTRLMIMPPRSATRSTATCSPATARRCRCSSWGWGKAYLPDKDGQRRAQLQQGQLGVQVQEWQVAQAAVSVVHPSSCTPCSGARRLGTVQDVDAGRRGYVVAWLKCTTSITCASPAGGSGDRHHRPDPGRPLVLSLPPGDQHEQDRELCRYVAAERILTKTSSSGRGHGHVAATPRLPADGSASTASTTPAHGCSATTARVSADHLECSSATSSTLTAICWPAPSTLLDHRQDSGILKSPHQRHPAPTCPTKTIFIADWPWSGSSPSRRSPGTSRHHHQVHPARLSCAGIAPGSSPAAASCGSVEHGRDWSASPDRSLPAATLA